MQLTDETVVATRLGIAEILIAFVVELRVRTGVCGQYAAVTVSGFDGCAVENKDDQQQVEPTRERGALVPG